MILAIYRFISRLATPLLHLLLARRLASGKEIAERIPEKWGITSIARPPGKLIWFHAASVGEMISILPLMNALLIAKPDLHILLTTVTTTSARLAQTKLPLRCIHQFLPLDTQAAVERFLLHWKPDAAWLTESELWPNLIDSMKKHVLVCGIINGRMSAKSFRTWSLFPKFTHNLMSGLHVFAQSEDDAKRYYVMGAKQPHVLGNLKLDAPALSYDEAMLHSLQKQVGARPVWLAASVHHQEYSLIEEIIHPGLKEHFPDILTVIVPRHPEKSEYLSAVFPHSTRRSLGEPITATTDVYIADTMGELGVFYRLCPIVLIGGSFFHHGGQNLVEPARIGCAIICGPEMFNFTEPLNALKQSGSCIQTDAGYVARELATLLGNQSRVMQMQQAGRDCVAQYSGITARICDALLETMKPVL
jgi:3-deoxy-D-manno-octulosonic-acid transferase